MTLSLRTAPKTFNLLSIGQRGVGKTVFLAGSHSELHSYRQTHCPQQLWFDCQDTQVQSNIEKILSYIDRTGEYPPPTMKVTSFNFSLKRRSLWGPQTLCQFRWWDIPGEICNIDNPDFRKMMVSSHGCCVFIDASMLVSKPAYYEALEDIIEEVMVIANLAYLNTLKYAFALILTKCDLLEPQSQQQLEDSLQPLTSRLDAVRANYQKFYSVIPIVQTEGTLTLEATGAAAPLLWLVRELSKAHDPGLVNNLLESVTSLLPEHLQPQQDLVDGELRSLFRPGREALGVKKFFGLYSLSTTRRNLLIAALTILGLMGLAIALFLNYGRFSQAGLKSLDTLRNPNIFQQPRQAE